MALAVGGTLLGSMVTVSAGSLSANNVDFQKLNARVPHAGHVFEGLAIINRTGLTDYPARFTFVRCDAAIGSMRLRAAQLVYGSPRPGYVQVIVCRWDIPADAAGKTLRFWTNKNPGCVGACGRRVVVEVNNGIYASPVYTWQVTNP